VYSKFNLLLSFSNVFNNCDVLQMKLDEYMDSNHDFNTNGINLFDTENIMLKFEKDGLSFLISDDGDNYIFAPSKNIEIIKKVWFDGDIPRQKLYLELSKLSETRTNFHSADYFPHRLKKVYFKYINNELVPFRYSLRK